MRELAKSAVSYTWAMSLFGVQQATSLLSPSSWRRPANKANGAFFSVKQAAENQFADIAFAAFLVGDEMQRNLTDLFFDAVAARPLNPAYVSKFASAVVDQSQDTLRAFSSAENARLAWQTLKNNYEVFNLVKHVSSMLHVIPGDVKLDVRRMINEAYALGALPALWS